MNKINTKYQYKLLLIFYFLICGVTVYAQNIGGLEVSKEKIINYQTIIDKNRNVVTFIENALSQNGLPKMLRNLSLIESGFDKNSVSSANAAGIWQFMEVHAAQYGLKSKDRYDIYHSTQTAMKTLKNLYEKYNNWITVVAAYNCGEGNIKKAINRANSNRYDKFYIYLPSETINHVQKFMESCLATNELDYLIADYKLSLFNTSSQFKKKAVLPIESTLTSIEINAVYNTNVIAEEIKIELSDLVDWDMENNCINWLIK